MGKFNVNLFHRSVPASGFEDAKTHTGVAQEPDVEQYNGDELRAFSVKLY
jgi:hypothetical protein